MFLKYVISIFFLKNKINTIFVKKITKNSQLKIKNSKNVIFARIFYEKSIAASTKRL